MAFIDSLSDNVDFLIRVAVFGCPAAKGLTVQANEEEGRCQRDVFLPSD